MNPAYVARDTLDSAPREGLRLSSVVPLKSIAEVGDQIDWPSGTYFRRGGLALRPLDGDEVSGGSLTVLYFEVYGLSRDEVGATQYEVALTVSEPEGVRNESFLKALSEFLGGDQAGGEVTLSWQRVGIKTSGVERLPLVMPKADATERLHLTIRISDHTSGSAVERTLFLQVVPGGL
jgi:hypothetical protein